MRTEEKLEKVKKSCKITKKVLDVVTIIFAVIAVVCLVAGILVIANKNMVNAEFAQAAANGDVDFYADGELLSGLISLDVEIEELVDKGEYATVLTILMVAGVVFTTIFAVVAKILSAILGLIVVKESPFCNEVIKRLKGVFIIITVLVLLASGIVEALITALFFRCIYFLFQYGNALQEQYDETL